MNRILMFIIFLSIFLTIFAGMHLYVISRLSGLLGVSKSVWLYVGAIAVASLFILLSFLERSIGGQVIRILYTINAVWIGVLWLLFVSLILFEIVKYFIKLEPFTYGIIIVIIVAVLSLYAIINAQIVRTNAVEVSIDGLKEPVSIVQLSDVHVGTIHNSDYLKKIIEKTNALEPDIVAITGDLVDGGGFYRHKSYRELASINTKTYFVTGNHEVYAGISEILNLFNDSAVVVLRNQVVEYRGLQIIGVDDPDNSGHKSVNDIEFDSDKPTILLRHQPALNEESAEAGIDLQLSGHTHNGQVWPFNYLVSLQYRPRVGLHRIGDMQLYITSGTGTWGPPMRFGSNSEIAKINLVPA